MHFQFNPFKLKYCYKTLVMERRGTLEEGSHFKRVLRNKQELELTYSEETEPYFVFPTAFTFV